IRHADFVAEYARAFNLVGEDRANQIEKDVENFVEGKKSADTDSAELRTIKGLIRRSEARDAARYAGVKEPNIHFLEMPFYETGRVRKAPLSEKDVQIVADLLKSIKPHQLYAAGDLADPHGTHRVCLEAIMQALARLKDEPWLKHCDLWLYRGAWHEFGVDEIEMAVPLSPDELQRKRM